MIIKSKILNSLCVTFSLDRNRVGFIRCFGDVRFRFGSGVSGSIIILILKKILRVGRLRNPWILDYNMAYQMTLLCCFLRDKSYYLLHLHRQILNLLRSHFPSTLRIFHRRSSYLLLLRWGLAWIQLEQVGSRRQVWHNQELPLDKIRINDNDFQMNDSKG